MFSSALKKVAVGIALIGTIGAANATTYNLGALDTTAGKSNIAVSTSFNDIFSFTAGALPDVLVSIVGIGRGTVSNASYAFATGSAEPTAWTWSPFAVTTAANNTFSYTTTVSGLTAGQTYWIDLKGNLARGSYAVTLTPVPEPESYAMLLAGLGLMGVVARRRKSKINTSVHGA
jgi:hypothetical protein